MLFLDYLLGVNVKRFGLKQLWGNRAALTGAEAGICSRAGLAHGKGVATRAGQQHPAVQNLSQCVWFCTLVKQVVL